MNIVTIEVIGAGCAQRTIQLSRQYGRTL